MGCPPLRCATALRAAPFGRLATIPAAGSTTPYCPDASPTARPHAANSQGRRLLTSPTLKRSGCGPPHTARTHGPRVASRAARPTGRAARPALPTHRLAQAFHVATGPGHTRPDASPRAGRHAALSTASILRLLVGCSYRPFCASGEPLPLVGLTLRYHTVAGSSCLSCAGLTRSRWTGSAPDTTAPTLTPAHHTAGAQPG